MEMEQRAAHAVTTAARLALTQWSQLLDSGREAMRTLPGLTAVVDQHVAQIRDTLGAARVDLLAAYADGVADRVTAQGWTAEETVTGWHRASWPSLHLLAVCVLAETA
jgi:hypothetical protein